MSMGNVAMADNGVTLDPSTSIAYTSIAPTIDGILEEAEWSAAVVVEDLHQVTPTEYDVPSQATRFMLLYDSDALYIGVRAYASDRDSITARLLRHYSPLRGEDRVKVILDPFNDKRSGYEFQVNPNSVRGDGIFKGERIDRDWDGIWQARSQIDAEGWTAEMKIPFKTLSFSGDGDWGLNLVREIVQPHELIAWSSRNRSVDPAVAGTLTGLTDISQGFGLDIVPSISVTGNRIYNPRNDQFGVEPSLDLYYKITTGLNGSLTFNTDFSATEVDSRQVNLTRFNLFFPEKRSFFQRESDIFDFGGIGGQDNTSTTPRSDRENGRPYFSRRIGLGSEGEPVDLDVGGKVSGRVGRWNIGAMAIRQVKLENVDASNLIVARASVNVLQESSVGFIATDGDPRTNLENSLVGFDFQYQNTRLQQGRRLEVDMWYQKTDTEGLAGDDAAFGIAAKMPNRSGWRGGISAKEIQQNFNPALGFVSRSGIRQYSTDIGYTYQRNGRLIRSVFSGIDGERADSIDGDLQSQNIIYRIMELETESDDELSFSYEVKKENLTEPFEISDGVIIPVGDYRFASNEIVFESARPRSINVVFEYRDGDFFDGKIRSTTAELGWRPSKHFNFSASYSVDDVDLPQGSFVSKLASTEIGIVFSNTLSWVNLVQYDNITDSIGINSRLHWAPQAGRNFFFVVNHNYGERVSDQTFHSTSTDVTIKFDYTFRF